VTLLQKIELCDHLIRKNPDSTVQDLTDAIKERETMERELEADPQAQVAWISPKHLKLAK
jgi:hypothetical protein